MIDKKKAVIRHKGMGYFPGFLPTFFPERSSRIFFIILSPYLRLCFSNKICGTGSSLFPTALFEQKPCQNADMTYDLEIFFE